MRLGVSTDFGKRTAKEWAENMERLGCRSVVFPLDSSAPAERVEEYVRAAKEHDLKIAEVGIWRNALSADPAEKKKNLDYSIAQLALADRIGARCAVNVAGAFGPRWDGGYRENFTREAWEATVRMIQHVIDAVQPRHTYLTIEPMPWMIPSGPEEYLRLIRDVDRERFGVHMDIINMISSPDRYFFSEEFTEDVFGALGDRIRSCHLKDIRLKDEYTFQLEECACGEGSFGFEKYAELANRADEDMPMIIEHLKSDDEYVASLKYMGNRLNKFC